MKMRSAWRCLGSLLSVTLLASCTTATHSATPPTEVSPSPLAILPATVNAAYSEFWIAWLAVNESLNYDQRLLSEHAADPLLQTLRANLAVAQDRNYVTRGKIVHQIRSMEVDGNARRITDCIDIGGWRLYDASNGSVVPNQLSGTRHQFTVLVLRLQSAKWKATNMYVYGQC
jgi:hypothetical protein